MDGKVISTLIDLKNNQNRPLNAFGELNHECDVLAKCIDYCFKEEKVASFKEPQKIAKMLEENMKKGGSILGEFGNTVIFKAIAPSYIGFRFSENVEDESTVIKITEVKLAKDGTVSGKRNLCILNKKNDGSYEEEGISSFQIDARHVALKNDKNHRELLKRMNICYNLFSPIMNIIKEKDQALLDINNMLEEIRNENKKISEIRNNK